MLRCEVLQGQGASPCLESLCRGVTDQEVLGCPSGPSGRLSTHTLRFAAVTALPLLPCLCRE